MNSVSKTVWVLNPWDALPGEIGFDRGMRLAEGLAAAGHAVVWFNADYSHAEKKKRQSQGSYYISCKIVLVPVVTYRNHTGVRRLLSLLSYSIAVFGLSFRHQSPRVILTCGPVPFSLIILVWYRLFHRSKIVTELRDLWPEGSVNLASSSFSRRLFRVLAVPVKWYRSGIFRSSSAMVFLNKTYERWFARHYAKLRTTQRSVVSYPSPFVSEVGALTTSKVKDTITFLFSGTLGASHDHMMLLRALAHRSFPSATFVVTGDGPNRQKLESHIRTAGLENIRVLGYLADSDYKGVLNDSDVGIALYLRGSPVSMPTKVIDYINAGKPLIVSAINEEAAEVVRKNDIGFVVDSLDDLVFAIARYCDDRELIDRHRRNVLSLKSEFEPSRQVEKIIALVGELS
jgi:hypothetical protein